MVEDWGVVRSEINQEGIETTPVKGREIGATTRKSAGAAR